MERLIGPELLAMQRVARELEGERDAALLDARTAQGMLQGYIDQANENAIRVQGLETERDAASAREAVYRPALAAALNACTAAKHQMEQPQMDGGNYDRAQRILARAQRTLVALLATPSPAAETLLELAVAAEVDVTWFEGESNGPVRVEELTPTYQALYLAVEKWRRARG